MSGTPTLPQIDPSKPVGPIADCADMRANFAATMAQLSSLDTRMGTVEGGDLPPVVAGTLIGPGLWKPAWPAGSGGSSLNPSPHLGDILAYRVVLASPVQAMGIYPASNDPDGAYHLGVYADSDLAPAALLYESPDLATSIGASVPWTFPAILPAGTYWFAFQIVSAPNPWFNATSTKVENPYAPGAAVADSSAYSGLIASGQGTAMPAVFPLGAATDMSGMLILLRGA
jgi:hypothetical protein